MIDTPKHEEPAEDSRNHTLAAADFLSHFHRFWRFYRNNLTQRLLLQELHLGFLKTYSTLLEQHGVRLGDRGIPDITGGKTDFDFMNSLIITHAADNFMTYLTDLLKLVFRRHPKAMKDTKHSELLADILTHDTMEQFVDYVADKKILKVSHFGVQGIQKYYKSLGFSLFETDPQAFELIAFICEVRNLMAHNRGIVNDLFKSRVPSYKGAVGKPIKMTEDQANAFLRIILTTVRDIDIRAIRKWNLETLSAAEFDERLRKEEEDSSPIKKAEAPKNEAPDEPGRVEGVS